MSAELARLLRENLALRGMSSEAIAQNLPGLLEKVTAKASSAGVTRPGNEGRRRDTKPSGPSGDSASVATESDGAEQPAEEKPRQTGHGPTQQPNIPVQNEFFDLDEPDCACPHCGGKLARWASADDEVEVLDSIQRQWVLRKCTLAKYRCPGGCTVVTADGPEKLIKGGRYTVDVAVDAAIAKYDDHIPLQRQVKMAGREGVRLTTQALWDQIFTLSALLSCLCERIRQHILGEPVIGVDLTGFSLIEKGGSKKKQVWQLSCPTAIYFEMLDTKKAEAGKELFYIDREAKTKPYRGIVMMDGAAELLKIGREVGFKTAACWSHARRNVLKAEREAPGQVLEFLDLVGELYEIDEKAASDPPPDDKRSGYRHRIDLEKLRVLRDTESRAVCDRIQEWILKQKCIPGGLLKAGLGYVAERWSRLTRILDDPRIPLDNNRTERGYIGLAIGRRNYIGARSERGMEVAADFYTIVESARVNGHDGRAYLRYAAHAACRGETPLLPHEWSPDR